MSTILTVPFYLEPRALAEKFKVSADDQDDFLLLLDQVQQVARPKVLYRVAFIDARDDNSVTIDGIRFMSRALRKNLENVNRVFAYVATCGTEVEQIKVEKYDFVRAVWLHYLKLELLPFCYPALQAELEQKFHAEKMAQMNPGSGDADVWRIEQQAGLFSLFGDVETQVGVHLTDTFLMVPEISVSGILFETEHDYQNCQLCQREDCPNRRAEFNATLWQELRT